MMKNLENYFPTKSLLLVETEVGKEKDTLLTCKVKQVSKDSGYKVGDDVVVKASSLEPVKLDGVEYENYYITGEANVKFTNNK